MSEGEFRVLDLYCGGMGAGWGYHLAGAAVTGVDNSKRTHLPEGVEFIKADARDVLTDLAFLRSFHLIHASPPCKVFTRLGSLVAARGMEPLHGDLLTPTRDALQEAGVPYVLENVEGAPMRPDVLLCGAMFNLGVEVDGEWRWLKRHRMFELGGWGNHGMFIQPEDIHPTSRPLGIYGRTIGDLIPGGGEVATIPQAQAIMAMPWASWGTMTQAIPPAYTHYLGSIARAELEATV